MRPSTVATEPGLPRLDMYGPVHKGLRYGLCALLTRLGALDVDETALLAMFLDDLEGVLYLCARHIEHEDNVVHAAIERRRPGATTSLAVDHHEHEAMIAQLHQLSDALLACAAGRRGPMGRALYLTLSRFVADNLAHMAEEEARLQPLLESLFDDAELHALEAELRAGIGPDEMTAFARVMVPANVPVVGLTLLSGSRRTMPPDAFAQLVRALRAELGEGRWQQFAAQLSLH